MVTTAVLTGSNAPPPPEPPTARQVTEWLDYTLADLTERLDDEILPALKAMIEAHPTIADGDEEAASLFTDNVRIAAAMERDAKERILAEKRPYIDATRTVDGWRDRFMTALGTPLQRARAILLDYQTHKAALARAEAERQAREAAERARQAAEAAAAAELAKKGLFDDLPETQVAADAARHAQNAAQIATGKPAQLSRTVGHYGSVASVRTRWDYEIDDFAKIPLEFLMLNDAAVKAAMKQRDRSGKPARQIPGLRWTEVASLGVR